MDGYWTPRILYVSREFWKPGHDAELNRIEAEGARVCIGLGVPRPYLGIESLTGSKEVWYLNGFASAGELAKVTEAYGKKPELLAAMNRFAQQKLNSSHSLIARDLRRTDAS
jgi:hypothetical protein